MRQERVELPLTEASLAEYGRKTTKETPRPPNLPITPTFPLLGPLGVVPVPTKWTIDFAEPIAVTRYGPEGADDPILVNRLSEQVRSVIQRMIAAAWPGGDRSGSDHLLAERNRIHFQQPRVMQVTCGAGTPRCREHCRRVLSRPWLRPAVVADTSTKESDVKQTMWVGVISSFLVSFSATSEAQPQVARHGMPSPVFQTESAVWKSQGYRLLHLSGYDVGGQTLYAAIWEQSSGPARIARHGMITPVFQTELAIWRSQGYRLVAVDGYSVGGQVLYAAIWEQAPGPEQVVRYGMPSPMYQAEFDIWTAQGYRLKKVEGYGVGGNAFYAAVWERSAGPAWKARHGLSLTQHLSEYLQNVAQGWRLKHVSGYSVGGADYYATIWEDADGPAWLTQFRQTSDDFQHQLVDRKLQGYRLKQVDGYAIGNAAHYAAIWEAEPASATGSYCDRGQCFDLRRAADRLEASLAGNVKYAFELRRGRSVIRRAQGPKRTAADPPASSFTAFDRFNPASVSKSVTAVATLQLLEKRGLTIDESIHRHLPSAWNIPANNETITFAEVLNHTSGLRGANAGGGEYHHLQQLMEHPIRLEEKVYQYENVNYSLLRILVASLDGYTDWAHNPGPNTAARFITYVNKKVFSPLGIYDVEYRPEPGGTLFYPNPPGSAHGTDYGDMSLTPGSAGTHVSVHELAVFGAATFNGMLLSDAMLEELKQHELGFRDLGALPDGGTCWGKGGYFPGSWNAGAELNSVLVHCDNGVTGMLVINGDPSAWAPLRDALVDAFVPE